MFGKKQQQPEASVPENLAADRERRKREDEEAKKEADEELMELLTWDEQERKEARTYDPPVTVESHGFSKSANVKPSRLNKFLKVGADTEAPIVGIERIHCVKPGHKPFVERRQSMTGCPDMFYYLVQRGEAIIAIDMMSGRQITVETSRWKVDLLLHRMIEVWKQNR